jgi:hypothetical protein
MRICECRSPDVKRVTRSLQGLRQASSVAKHARYEGRHSVLATSEIKVRSQRWAGSLR